MNTEKLMLEFLLSLSIVVTYILYAFVLSEQADLFLSWFLLILIPIVLLVIHIIFVISHCIKKGIPSIIDILFFIPIQGTIFLVPTGSERTLYTIFLFILLITASSKYFYAIKKHR